MILKIFKAVWFLSLLIWLLIFLYVYASLPEEVVIREEGGKLISREGLFYVFLATSSLFAALVLTIRKLYHSEDFLIWFHGLIICLHFFFIVSLNLINLVNSGEAFDYARIGYVVYGSLGLFVLWGLGWPVYSIFRKFLSKEAV